MMPRRSLAHEGVGRCTIWQTARGPERYTNTGHGAGGVASAGPQACGEERVAGSLLAPGLRQACLWLPGRCPCAHAPWISAFVVFRALAAPTAVVMVAESGLFNFLTSVRELAALSATSGACSASSWLRFSRGRQGWGLGIPQPFRGCRKGCGLASVLGSSWVVLVGGLAPPGLMLGAVYAAGMFVLAGLFWGRLGRGLVDPWLVDSLEAGVSL